MYEEFNNKETKEVRDMIVKYNKQNFMIDSFRIEVHENKDYKELKKLHVEIIKRLGKQRSEYLDKTLEETSNPELISKFKQTLDLTDKLIPDEYKITTSS